jgi:signal transduction histidine kinase
MLKDGKVVGSIVIYRREVQPFTEKQVALVENFAAQAVIAIENTRLLNELRQRTADLTESLEQQTATAEVLGVISRSKFELQPILQSVVDTAMRLCRADQAIIYRPQSGTYRFAAGHSTVPEYLEIEKQTTIVPGHGTVVGRAALTRQVARVDDPLADPLYEKKDDARVGGVRSMIGVPLMRDGEPIGVIGLARNRVEPFTDHEIELVTTFADQAVIAIENVRLFEAEQQRTRELTESLQQQSATADVLKVISRSPFDLQTVLDTLVESAARLCDADSAAIHRPDGNSYPYVASYGYSREYHEYMRERTMIPGRGTVLGRAVTECKPTQVNDVAADPEYTLREGQRLGGFRTVLGIPLLRESAPIGVIVLTRKAVRPFTDKQIELATTFADQAAIAIENVRLFEAEQQRTQELARSLEELRTVQDRLVQTQKLASLGQLTAGIAHEIKNPLNFVNNFSDVSVELIDELREALADAALGKGQTEITELTDTLRSNLDKIMQHGKRADSIVKNMLLHSREGTGERRPVDINGLVEEAVNLAYHGARAEKKGFNITLERALDPTAGQVDCFPQEIIRVLLNLIANGFYAATQRKGLTENGDYEPTLAAATRNLGDRVEIRIWDNGAGIPPEVKEKMFNPFFTTKPAGEGTGLGLSISHDVIVKQHSGIIEVESRPGEFTEFRIVLPRAAATLAKSGGTA